MGHLKNHTSPALGAIAAVAGIWGVATPLQAEGLAFSAEFSVELENDGTVDSTDKAAEINDFFATIQADVALQYGEGSGIFSHLVLEPIRDPVDDRFLEDHGLYAEELYFAHDFGAARIKLGKFNPSFGMAWDAAPGIYGVDFAEDYELTERVGGGVDIPLAPGSGAATLSLASYFADTSFLSDSALASRGNVDKADGGVSNTQSLQSFSAQIAGEAGETGYTLGLRYQERGAGDVADEKGAVLGLTQPIRLGASKMGLLGEVAWFPDYDGGTDHALYATFGASVDLQGPFGASAVYALRDVENTQADHLATLSLDYELADDMVLSAAYRYGREGGEDNHTIGLLFAYEFSFGGR